MKRIKITVLLILLCVLAGCSPKDTSLRAYCTESQQEFLDQSLEELPVALTYHHNDNILGRYETTDEEIISEILQALRETTIVSKAFSGSTDSRILEFETADKEIHLQPSFLDFRQLVDALPERLRLHGFIDGVLHRAGSCAERRLSSSSFSSVQSRCLSCSLRKENRPTQTGQTRHRASHPVPACVVRPAVLKDR